MSRRSTSSRKSDSSVVESKNLDSLLPPKEDSTPSPSIVSVYKKYGPAIAVAIVLLAMVGLAYYVWTKKQQKTTSTDESGTMLQDTRELVLKQQQVIESLHKQLLQTQEQLGKAVEKLNVTQSMPVILTHPMMQEDIVFTDFPRPSMATIVEEEEMSDEEEERLLDEAINEVKAEIEEEKVELQPIVELKFDNKITSHKPETGKKRGRKSKA